MRYEIPSRLRLGTRRRGWAGQAARLAKRVANRLPACRWAKVIPVLVMAGSVSPLSAIEKQHLVKSAVCLGTAASSMYEESKVKGTGFLLEIEGRWHLITAYHVVYGWNNLQMFSTAEDSLQRTKRISLVSVSSGKMRASPASDSCVFVITEAGVDELRRPPFSRVAISGGDIDMSPSEASAILAVGNPTQQLLPGSPLKWGRNQAGSASFQRRGLARDLLGEHIASGLAMETSLLVLSGVEITYGYSGGPAFVRDDEGDYRLCGMVQGGNRLEKTTSWAIAIPTLLSHLKNSEESEYPPKTWMPKLFADDLTDSVEQNRRETLFEPVEGLASLNCVGNLACALINPVENFAYLLDWVVKADSGGVFPPDKQGARAGFVSAWTNPALWDVRMKIDQEQLFQAFNTQVLMCRDEEMKNPARPNAHYWADQAISHFEMHPQWAHLHIASKVLKLNVYYDQIQSESADFSVRKGIIQNGLSLHNAIESLIRGLPDAAPPLKPELRARIERLASTFLYESAKPENPEVDSWDTGILSLALEHASRAEEYDPTQSYVPRLRVLRRLADANPAEYGELAVLELRKMEAYADKAYERGGADELAFMNNYAVFLHEIMMRQGSSTGSGKWDDVRKTHAKYSVRLQERVLSLVETGRAAFAFGRKADFVFDLARMKGWQAALTRESNPGAAKTYTMDAIKLIRKLEEDPDIPPKSRKRLFKDLFNNPELASVLEAPELKNIVSYAKGLKDG